MRAAHKGETPSNRQYKAHLACASLHDEENQQYIRDIKAFSYGL